MTRRANLGLEPRMKHRLNTDGPGMGTRATRPSGPTDGLYWGGRASSRVPIFLNPRRPRRSEGLAGTLALPLSVFHPCLIRGQNSLLDFLIRPFRGTEPAKHQISHREKFDISLDPSQFRNSRRGYPGGINENSPAFQRRGTPPQM